ncbi:hypothetical protein Nmel_016194, partial [Mimus melanotis]
WQRGQSQAGGFVPPFPLAGPSSAHEFPFFPLCLALMVLAPSSPCSDIPAPGQLPHGKGQGRLSSGTRVQPGEIWSPLKSLSIPSESGETL